MTRIIQGRADRFRPEVARLRGRAGFSNSRCSPNCCSAARRRRATSASARPEWRPIETLEDLDDVLQPMLERGFVIYLTEPDRRGAIVSHGFHSPDELVRLEGATTRHAPASVSVGVSSVPAAPVPSFNVAEWEGRLAARWGRNRFAEGSRRGTGIAGNRPAETTRPARDELIPVRSRGGPPMNDETIWLSSNDPVELLELRTLLLARQHAAAVARVARPPSRARVAAALTAQMPAELSSRGLDLHVRAYS